MRARGPSGAQPGGRISRGEVYGRSDHAQQSGGVVQESGRKERIPEQPERAGQGCLGRDLQDAKASGVSRWGPRMPGYPNRPDG